MKQKDLDLRIDKTLEYLRTELAQLRTGRATPALIEDVLVNAYDTKMSVKELGSITVLDSQNLVIIPWDKNLLKPIAKALRENELNLNPVEDSDKIRIPIPSLTEDRRLEFSKIVSTKVEEAKNSIRNIRQDAKKDIEQDFSNKVISEDEKYSEMDKLEETIKEGVSSADEIGESKKKDLMTI